MNLVELLQIASSLAVKLFILEVSVNKTWAMYIQICYKR
jgi:hypothetical protein